MNSKKEFFSLVTLKVERLALLLFSLACANPMLMKLNMSNDTRFCLKTR